MIKKSVSEMKITCWGDSLTEGMGMPLGKSYPEQLGQMLGEGYRVFNGGDGGETSFAIAARQGGQALYAAKDIVFPCGVRSADIGTDGTGLDLATIDGEQRLVMLGWLGHDIDMTTVTADGKAYTLAFKNGSYDWSHRNNAFILTRTDHIDTEVTIRKGTRVYLSGSEDSDIQIYYAGANNKAPYNTSSAIIADINAMIAHHGSDKYLVVMPHWTKAHDQAFAEAFGSRAVKIRAESIENGLAYEGLSATDDDVELMAQGLVPASLRHQNKKNEIHFNENGYHFLAHLVYERGHALKFW